MDRVVRHETQRRIDGARLRLLRADALGAVVDAELIDARGDVQLAVHGLLLRPATSLAAPSARVDLDHGLHSLVWERDEAPLSAELPLERVGVWWLLDQNTSLGERIAARLRAAGARVRIVTAARESRRVAEDRFEVDVTDPHAWRPLLEGGEAPRAVLHLWSLDASTAEVPERARWLCEGALAVLRALVGSERGAAPQLWIAAVGAEVAVAAEPARSRAGLAAASLFGLARVVEFEHPELQCATIDLAADDSAHACDALWAELCSPSGASRVAHRGRARLLPRLVPAAPTSSVPHRVDAEALYVITGGAGALGLQVARWLVERGARHLTLVSRHAPSETRRETLSRLKERCPDLQHRRADVSERAQLAKVLDEIRSEGRPLRGVFHLAGVLEDVPLLRTDADRLDAMLGAKLRGAWHLHELTLGEPLTDFVLFSSLGSLVGLPGQGGYSAANAFLDSLAHQRRALGLAAISINWSVWEGEGMAPTEAQERLARRGFQPLTSDVALRALDAVLASDPAQIAVLAADEQALRALADRSRASASAQAGGWREELSALPAGMRVDQCERRIRGVLRDVLGLDVAMLASDAPLVDMGIDSLRAVELRNALSRRTGLRLPASFAFDCATLGRAARALVERLGLADSETPSTRDAETGVADLSSLPADELLGLVDQALQQLGTGAAREG